MANLTQEEIDLLNSTNEPQAEPQNYGSLSPTDMEAILKEQQLAREFDRPISAAVLGALRGLSLGFSDQALIGLGVKPETLKQIKEQSPYISGASEVAGVVTPALATGGAALPAGAVARGAQRIGIAAAEKAATQAGKKIAQNLTTGAVEGAAFSAGNAISEAALDNKKLTAEAVIGSIGTGATLGGLLGGAIGAGSAALPKIGKITSPITRRAEQYVDDFLSPVRAAEELSGLTPKRLIKLNEGRPAGQTFSDDLLEYTQTHLVTPKDIAATAEDLVAANARTVKAAGDQIGRISKVLDDQLSINPEILSPTEVERRLAAMLEKNKEGLTGLRRVKSSQARKLAEFEKDVSDVIKKMRTASVESQIAQVAEAAGLPVAKGQGSFSILDKLRKDLQDITYNPLGTKLDNFPATVAESLRAEIRSITNDAAEQLAAKLGGDVANIARDLKYANKTYHVGMQIKPTLAMRAQKRGDLGLWEIVKGGDIKRNLMVVANIGKQVKSTKQVIKDSVKTFFEKTKKPTSILTNKLLSDSGFALTEDNRRPKNDKTAFKNIESNIIALASDPYKMQEKLIKATASLMAVSPELGFEAQQQLVSAVEFLNNKLPKHVGDGMSQLLFSKEYEPTTIERAKFQRYLQIAEQPLSIMQELEQGTITREHVEALKYIYPEIYKEVQLSVMDMVAQNPGISYQKRLQLGILLNIPADESLTGEAIMGLQNNFTPEPMEQPKNGNVQAAQTAQVKDIDIANRLPSGTEELTNRRT